MTTADTPAGGCLLCGTQLLTPIAPDLRLACVSSDAFPLAQQAAFAVCPVCGMIQKVRDDAWNTAVAAIYANYKVYPLETVQTHLMFSKTGTAKPRSLILAEHLAQAVSLPQRGRLLDIGCGNGDFLHSFKRVRPEWDVCGFEPSEASRAALEAHLPGVRFYSGSLDAITDRFDCLTLNYVIEHLFEPVAMLRQMQGLLSPGGGIFVQTTSFQRNPFDLVIMDHCAHFTPETVAQAGVRAGLRLIASSNGWLEKEIGWYAQPAETPLAAGPDPLATRAAQDCERMVHWLKKFPETVRQAAAGRPLGIFGTAIAGTWLAGVMPGEVAFFVDEDPQRQGQRHLGLPILAPQDTPTAAAVVLAFPAGIASAIAARLEKNGFDFAKILPPAFEELPTREKSDGMPA